MRCGSATPQVAVLTSMSLRASTATAGVTEAARASAAAAAAERKATMFDKGSAVQWLERSCRVLESEQEV